MTTHRFRGILGIAALLAGLPPPPPVRPLEPELTQEQINEIVSWCEIVGVYMEFAERCQGDFLRFQRLAEAAIAAKTKPPAPEPTVEVTGRGPGRFNHKREVRRAKQARKAKRGW